MFSSPKVLFVVVVKPTLLVKVPIPIIRFSTFNAVRDATQERTPFASVVKTFDAIGDAGNV